MDLKRSKYLQSGCTAVIMVTFLVTRFYRLTTLPTGLHIDEAGMSYDAWCLANYGVDRYLKSWPVYLMSGGSGQSALYAYLCAVCIKIFGFHVWSIRLPGIVSSLLLVVFGMKIAKSIFPEQPWLTYATGALLVICPYFIQASRIGLDCNLALGFSTLFLYLLICALEGGKTTAYIFAGVAGGLLLYTYALTWIFVPVFLILAVCYLLWTKKMTLKKWVIMAIPFGLLAFPLILMQMVNLFGWDELHIGIFTITKLGTYRISEIGAASWSNLVRAMESIFASDALAYNTIPGGNALYKISIPIFILGFCGTLGRFFLSIYRRQCDTRCLVFLWFLSVLYLEVHIEANANKINAIFFSVVLIAMEGISVLEHVGGRLRDCIAVVLTGAYFICFASFATYYYGGSYTAETYLLPYFDTTVEEAVQFIQADEELAGKATYMAEDKIYYAVSGFPTPYQYQEALMQTDGELPSCGNFYFNGLGAIEDDCNYIVRDTFDEYKEELRQNGFTEIVYGHYSLFYQKTR